MEAESQPLDHEGHPPFDICNDFVVYAQNWAYTVHVGSCQMLYTDVMNLSVLSLLWKVILEASWLLCV